MSLKRAHIFLEGRVQGVYFRSYSEEWAKQAGVTGWIKNTSNGKLEALLEGEEEDVVEVIAYMRQGPPYAQVTGVKVEWQSPTGEFNSFSIKH